MRTIKGFQMTVAVAQKFYQLCIERNATTRDERMAILNEMIHTENIRILNAHQITEACKGKKVYVVSPKPEDVE